MGDYAKAPKSGCQSVPRREKTVDLWVPVLGPAFALLIVVISITVATCTALVSIYLVPEPRTVSPFQKLSALPLSSHPTGDTTSDCFETCSPSLRGTGPSRISSGLFAFALRCPGDLSVPTGQYTLRRAAFPTQSLLAVSVLPAGLVHARVQ